MSARSFPPEAPKAPSSLEVEETPAGGDTGVRGGGGGGGGGMAALSGLRGAPDGRGGVAASRVVIDGQGVMDGGGHGSTFRAGRDRRTAAGGRCCSCCGCCCCCCCCWTGWFGRRMVAVAVAVPEVEMAVLRAKEGEDDDDDNTAPAAVDVAAVVAAAGDAAFSTAACPSRSRSWMSGFLSTARIRSC